MRSRADCGRHERMPGKSSEGSEKAVGNFVLGESFGNVKCRNGHEMRLFNIGRGHFVACDTCRTYMLLGSNLTGSWRHEDEAIWRSNSDSVEGYEFLG